ncbi:MAG: NUDIX hydrolase [Treponema sp.]|nr:NUDIX hydrolase [Treponema sp.]
MRTLLDMDLKNYREDGTVGRRPSVRGIIFSNGKIALVHSLKYDYYKLPGGGIEAGEDYRQALYREVLEETGIQIHSGSVKEYGQIIRKEKGLYDDLFIQENFYYLARPLGIKEQKLDDYEAEEGFTLEWVTLEHAIDVNENHNHGGKYDVENGKHMVQRETFVFKKLLEENETYKNERAVCIVVRNDKLLLEHMFMDHHFYDVPGGGIEKGETPEEAAVRELKEECCIEGRVVRKLTTIYNHAGYYDAEHCFLMEVNDDADVATGSDPELNPEDQTIKNVEWRSLEEIPERDRAFIFWRGLLEVDLFRNKVFSWKEEISYPGK